jgi:alpha-N-acetylglucosamine transferase
MSIVTMKMASLVFLGFRFGISVGFVSLQVFVLLSLVVAYRYKHCCCDQYSIVSSLERKLLNPQQMKNG